MPLPQESRFSGRSSGNRPYLEGPKIALCTPMKKIAARPMGRFLRANPAVAKAMIKTSNTFTETVTVRLLKWSARKPPAMENRMNGSANKAAVKVNRAFCFSAETTMLRPINVTSVWRALSLNAPSNWVTMRLQNPRMGDCAGSADSAYDFGWFIVSVKALR